MTPTRVFDITQRRGDGRAALKSFPDEKASETTDVAHGSHAFAGPDVEVQPAARHGRLADEIENQALAEPDRGAHGGGPPEHRRVPEVRVEADQTAHRRS